VLVHRVPNDQFPSLGSRVLRVVEDSGQRVSKHREPFGETHAVFPCVGSRLGRIPFELESHGYPQRLPRPIEERLGKGSHRKLVHPTTKKEIWVWVHSKKDVGRLARHILRDTGLG
jgi:hypothetical protein